MLLTQVYNCRRIALGAIVITLILIAAGELAARFYLGFGTPPLSIADRQTEYQFAPDQDVMRFGNRQLYNEYSMRSAPLNDIAADRLILVMGDSVLNGGSETDHADLATTIASDEEVFYGNASAHSWGPANLSGWIEKYGFVGADTVILLLNSGDLTDLPTFAPLHPLTFPTNRPISALYEGVLRHLPRFLRNILIRWADEPGSPGPVIENETLGRAVIERLIAQIAEAERNACMIQHLSKRELENGPEPAYQTLRRIFERHQVPVLSMESAERRALAIGPDPYRDDIHLTPRGHRILVPFLQRCARIARVPQVGAEPSH